MLRVSVGLKDFRWLLSCAGRGADARSVIPAFSCILLRADPPHLVAAGTDGDQTIIAWASASTTEAGDAVIPAKPLAQLADYMEGDPVRLEVDGNSLRLISGPHESTIRGLDPADFPTIPDPADLKDPLAVLSAEDLMRAIDQVALAADSGNWNTVRDSISLRAQSVRMTLAATNGYLLAEKSIPLARPPSEGFHALILAKHLQILADLLRDAEEAEIFRMGNHLLGFRAEMASRGILLVSREVEGRFPDYTHLLSPDPPTVVEASREDVLRALKALWPFTVVDRKVRMVRLRADDESIVLQAGNDEGKTQAAVPARRNGNPVEIILNPEYLMRPLKVMEDNRIRLGFRGPLDPIHLSAVSADGSDPLYLIAPLHSPH